MAEALARLTVIQINVSTLHPAEFKSSSTKQHNGATSRMFELGALFHSLDAAIVFVQEGRLPESGQRHLPHYKLFISGATASTTTLCMLRACPS